MDLWAYQRGVTLDFSRPGKPNDNAYIEAFDLLPLESAFIG
ncbi:transposase [Rhodobacterales bacterium HTCC2654]|uniref:Transposase n=1 Tax=Maritimibacter alkaliphilus HTCC2654 TaxID=314271 RepID=A3VLL9_9RHOB|nr:transposase [Rhodobacterales bacterium HTCC2654] [Maritimibacter alkaliphilus HTCC2654]